MKLSKKSIYGITALVELEHMQKQGHVALNAIAQKNDISQQYLEQVFAALRKGKLVKSIKGAQGGYLLNKDPKDITVGNIIECIDGSYKFEDIDIDEDINGAGVLNVVQSNVLDELNKKIEDFLEGLTLEDLCNKYKDFIENSLRMYYI